MRQVYIKAYYSILELPNFWRKLKRFLGEFRIEQQSMEDSIRGIITISFHTDKVEIPEGEDRQVILECRSNERGSWYFTSIEYFA
jgi:hypothetical protein